MADPITEQQLIDAATDAETLEQFVSGDENTDVTSRLGRSYATLAKMARMTQMAGGLVGFATKTELLAYTPASGSRQLARVYGDGTTANNGDYYWTGSAWIKSDFDPGVRLSAVEQQALRLSGPSQTIGYITLPASAPNGSGGTYTFLQPISATGRGIRYRYRSNAAGTIYVQLQAKSGDTVTVVSERAVTVSGAGEFVVEFADWAYTAGQYVGIRVSATGVIAALGGTYPDGWLYTNAQVAAGGSYTDTTATTNVCVLHRIDLLEQVVTSERFLALESSIITGAPDSYHLHWVLGESHAAGVPTQLSTVVIPAGRGYQYRRATNALAHLQDPTGNSATASGPPGRGSAFVSFGAQMLKRTDGRTGAIVVNSAIGGTVVGTHWGSSGTAWLDAVNDWNNAVAAINAAGHIVSGVSVSLIIGSNDAAAGTAEATFKTQMLDLIARARALVGAGPLLPVVMMETGPYGDGSNAAGVAMVQRVQAEIARDTAGVYIGYSARQAVARGQMIDNVHMNQTFNDVLGSALATVAEPRGAGLHPSI